MTDQIVVITSGAYVAPEIAAEFGLIPPSFLPIGNRRLYSWQVEALRASLPDAQVFMTVPETFDISVSDRAELDELEVTLIPSPEGLSLGSAVSYAVLSTGRLQSQLLILHGDTLLLDYPYERSDVLSSGRTDAYYAWASFSRRRGGALSIRQTRDTGEAPQTAVLTGAFSFSDTPLFLRCLATSHDNFVEAVAEYSAHRRLDVLDEGRWLDFGHLHTYFQSRRRITTERAFNRLETRQDFFLKTSQKKTKLEAERDWFLKLPGDLRVFAPTVIPAETPRGYGGYMIEYVYSAPLSDLFVFGRLPANVWRTIFDACDRFLTAASGYPAPRPDVAGWLEAYGPKTRARLATFAQEAGIDLDAEWTINGRRTPSLNRIVDLLEDDIGAPDASMMSIIHGDFCFSNILFDFRTNRVKLIDPRGLDAADRPTIHGDRRYETAKLHHSVVGGYDLIIAGRHRTERSGRRQISIDLFDDSDRTRIRSMFEERRFVGRTLGELKAHQISVLLFLSMLPLHSDDPRRQMGLLANGLRLFSELDRRRG